MKQTLAEQLANYLKELQTAQENRISKLIRAQEANEFQECANLSRDWKTTDRIINQLKELKG